MATKQHTYTLSGPEKAELRNGIPEICRIVEPQPGPHSHVYQHPTERWWCFGDNSGRTYEPPVLEVPEGYEAGDPVIEEGDDGMAWWVWRPKAVQPA